MVSLNQSTSVVKLISIKTTYRQLTHVKNKFNLPTSQLYSRFLDRPAIMNPVSNLCDSMFENKQLGAQLLIALLAVMQLSACTKDVETTQVIRPALAYKIGASSGVDADVYPGEIRADRKSVV